MASDRDIQIKFITDARQCAQKYRQMIQEVDELRGRYSALMNGELQETDFDSGNAGVIPSGDPATRLNSLVSVMANFDTISAAFDAGIDTNIGRLAY